MQTQNKKAWGVLCRCPDHLVQAFRPGPERSPAEQSRVRDAPQSNCWSRASTSIRLTQSFRLLPTSPPQTTSRYHLIKIKKNKMKPAECLVIASSLSLHVGSDDRAAYRALPPVRLRLPPTSPPQAA